jgi:hypothetical protein
LKRFRWFAELEDGTGRALDAANAKDAVVAIKTRSCAKHEAAPPTPAATAT